MPTSQQQGPHSTDEFVKGLWRDNPVFVQVDGQPIRSSRRSAEWCRKAVDVCWNSKEGQIRSDEQEAARAAYEQAADIYDRIATESVAE